MLRAKRTVSSLAKNSRVAEARNGRKTGSEPKVAAEGGERKEQTSLRPSISSLRARIFLGAGAIGLDRREAQADMKIDRATASHA